MRVRPYKTHKKARAEENPFHIRLSQRLELFYDSKINFKAPNVLFGQRSFWSNYVLLVETISSVKTHPIGSACSLEVDAVALGWWQRRVPETPVTLIVSHCERLHNGKAGWKQLCSNVVRRVQDGGIAEADGGGETLGRFRGGTASLALAMLLYYELVRAANATFGINTTFNLPFGNLAVCCLWLEVRWSFYFGVNLFCFPKTYFISNCQNCVFLSVCAFLLS